MKTRSNMPLFVVECSDVKALSNSQINQLRCGDYLVKKDASGEHAYKVSYKKDGVGICLTYCDGSGYIETISYDFVDGNWVYNSTDIFTAENIPMENIKDKDGHKRFIEDNVTTVEIEGVTYGYAKWSLSGSHLMIVVAGEITSGTSLSSKKFAEVNLPSWIMQKIYPIQGLRVALETFIAYASDFTTQNFVVAMNKGDTNLALFGAINATADRAFRVAFDILIDNE